MIVLRVGLVVLATLLAAPAIAQSVRIDAGGVVVESGSARVAVKRAAKRVSAQGPSEKSESAGDDARRVQVELGPVRFRLTEGARVLEGSGFRFTAPARRAELDRAGRDLDRAGRDLDRAGRELDRAGRDLDRAGRDLDRATKEAAGKPVRLKRVDTAVRQRTLRVRARAGGVEPKAPTARRRGRTLGRSRVVVDGRGVRATSSRGNRLEIDQRARLRVTKKSSTRGVRRVRIDLGGVRVD